MNTLLQNIPVSTFLQGLIGAIAIVLVTFIAVYVCRVIINALLKKIASRTATELDDKLIEGTRKKLYLLLYLLGLSVLFNYLQGILEQQVGPKFFEVLDGLIYAGGVLLVANILVKIFSTVFKWYGAVVATRTETQVDDEFIPLLDRATKVILYVISVLIILDHFKVDIKGMITVLGIGSLAIALAAQETIANMIGGFVIMIDRPFRIGDWLQLPDDTTCRVYQIGVRSTKFLTLENTLIIVPNAELMKSTVHNITYPYPEVRVKIDVGVAYGSDIELVKRVMLEETAKQPLILDDPEPFFRFEQFGDSSLNVSIFCRVAEVLDQYTAGSELRSQILERFRKEGIEIPFPQRVVTMVNPRGDKDKPEA